MIETPTLHLPATRAEALDRLEAFLPQAGRYASRRNHVVPGHENVSLLSPAARTRLLLETEIAEAAQDRFSPSTVEKFVQEVWWRLYWKGWLEMRPAVWTHYLSDLRALERSERTEEVAAGRSGVAIMDHFARELVETGYLHNHARMWWAAFWIHVERLPWQLGADFFLRHLRDGDAASNTLSWRWVAGLHTRGKSYLVRRSNVEKYVDEEILAANRPGIDRLDRTSEIELPFVDPPVPVPVEEENLPADLPGPVGLWVHDEDLLLERSPLSDLAPDSIAAFAPTGLWDQLGYAAQKRAFLEIALRDGAERAAEHFDCTSGFVASGVLSEDMIRWAREKNLGSVVAMRPFTGPLADEVAGLRPRLEEAGIRLALVRRPEDIRAMNKATSGFFGFWKKTESLRAR